MSACTVLQSWSQRRRWWSARLPACTVTGVALLLAALPATANAAAWSPQSPAIPQVANGQLVAVNCTSTTACTAVGSFTDSSGSDTTMAQRWNGTSWSRQTTASPHGAQLNRVRCPTTTLCVAVGSYLNASGTQVTLIERWNGTTWSIQPSPNPDGAVSSTLSGVTCTSTSSCVAVGYATFPGSVPGFGAPTQMLIERWDGSSWSIQPLPASAEVAESRLSGISCSSAGACTAVGHHFSAATSGDQPLAARWNGTTWSMQILPMPSGVDGASLAAVSCPSSTACIAVGGFSASFGDAGGAWTAHWTGGNWSIQTISNPSGATRSALGGVSCTAPTACMAVGWAFNDVDPSNKTNVPMAARWNGTAWSVEAAPNPGATRLSSFDGVSCGSATMCLAVGSSSSNGFIFNGPNVPLAERWNGSTWSIQTTATAMGAADSRFTGVRCTSSTACTAVGGFTPSEGGHVTLAERWNGTTWSIQTTPKPSGAVESWFKDVTCTSSTACTAVGVYTTSTHDQYAFAERWNGVSWSVQTIPRPTGASSTDLEAVSCPSSTACTAVGSFSAGAGGGPLAVRWNGTAWSMQTTPTIGSLTGVSCPTSTTCTAVGFTGNFSATLAERWSGSNWSIQPTPASRGEFKSVSCPTSTACTAVGDTPAATLEGRPLVLAERWDGTSWFTQSTVTPDGDISSTFDGVTCPSSSSCVAVGASIDASFAVHALAERWNGSTWAIEETPEPSGPNQLRAVSCAPGGGTCFTVGETSSATLELPLVERYA